MVPTPAGRTSTQVVRERPGTCKVTGQWPTADGTVSGVDHVNVPVVSIAVNEAVFPLGSPVRSAVKDPMGSCSKSRALAWNERMDPASAAAIGGDSMTGGTFRDTVVGNVCRAKAPHALASPNCLAITMPRHCPEGSAAMSGWLELK